MKVLTIGLPTFNNAPHNRLWQDMASMVEKMSSYLTALADAADALDSVGSAEAVATAPAG